MLCGSGLWVLPRPLHSADLTHVLCRGKRVLLQQQAWIAKGLLLSHSPLPQDLECLGSRTSPRLLRIKPLSVVQNPSWGLEGWWGYPQADCWKKCSSNISITIMQEDHPLCLFPSQILQKI